MKKRRMFIAGLSAAALAALLVVSVRAVTDIERRSNYLGSSDAVAALTTKNVDTLRWASIIESGMVDPPVTINVIGRRIWTVWEICGQTQKQEFKLGAHVITGSYYARRKNVTKEPCNFARYGWSVSRHDFNNLGANGYCPGFSSTYWCPDLNTGYVSVP